MIGASDCPFLISFWNYLMRVATDEDRKQVRAFWNEMLEQLGRRDINRFLRHMWVSKYGDLKNTDLFTALKDHIEKKSINSLDFTSDCASECESYVQVIDVDETRVGKAALPVRSLVKTLDFSRRCLCCCRASPICQKQISRR